MQQSAALWPATGLDPVGLRSGGGAVRSGGVAGGSGVVLGLHRAGAVGREARIGEIVQQPHATVCRNVPPGWTRQGFDSGGGAVRSDGVVGGPGVVLGLHRAGGVGREARIGGIVATTPCNSLPEPAAGLDPVGRRPSGGAVRADGVDGGRGLSSGFTGPVASGGKRGSAKSCNEPHATVCRSMPPVGLAPGRLTRGWTRCWSATPRNEPAAPHAVAWVGACSHRRQARQRRHHHGVSENTETLELRAPRAGVRSGAARSPPMPSPCSLCLGGEAVPRGLGDAPAKLTPRRPAQSAAPAPAGCGARRPPARGTRSRRGG